jgi:signal peptide peptidase SppA
MLSPIVLGHGRLWALTEHRLRGLGRELLIAAGSSTRTRRRAETNRAGGGVFVLNVLGLLTQRPTWYSTSTLALAGVVSELASDPHTTAIVLQFDTPGGEFQGAPEAAAAIRAARATVPIVASVQGMACSAGYYLAGQCTEIMASPSSELGSIGVYTVHEDLSAALDAQGYEITLISAGEGKVDGSPYGPLSDEARADLQAAVNRAYGMFVGDVASGRRVPAAQVRSTWKAKSYGAHQAVEMGLADGVGTLADAVARAGQLVRTKALSDEVDMRMRARARGLN